MAGLVVVSVGGFERVPLPAAMLEHRLGPLSAAASILWIVTVVNFYNFIDGIDGIASLQALITATGVLLAGFDPVAALLAAAVVGATAGFLRFNWSPASVFLGDVGSYFLGYTLAALPLLAPRQLRSQAALFVAVSLWLFLADATFTLIGRALRGERIYEAHREHLYQMLAQRCGHARVAAGARRRVIGPDRGGVRRGGGGRPPQRARSHWRWEWLSSESSGAHGKIGRTEREGSLALARARLGSPGGRRLVLILGFDALLILASLYVAYLLRFDGGPIPPEHRAILARFLPLFLVIRLSLHLAFGLHRWSFRLSGLHEALRVVSATALGTATFVAVFYFLQTPGPPRSVLVMEFFLTASLVGRLPVLAALRADLAARAVALALRARASAR